MTTPATRNTYRDLADAYEERGQSSMRDRFLVLAADAAYLAGQEEEAERLRLRLLQGNPHHMLKPYSSYAQALEASAIQIYIQDLRLNYPPEIAEKLLHSLQEENKDEEAATSTAPPTAPFLDTEGRPIVAVGNERDPMEIYPLETEPERARPIVPLRPTQLHRPRQFPAPRPAPVDPPREPQAPPSAARPQGRPRPQPAPAAVLPPTLAPVDPFAPLPPSDAELPRGAWLPLLLFGMVATAGIALAVYTLTRPFLPPQWLP